MDQETTVDHSPEGVTRIVIVGGGFGGASCAQQLEKRLGSRLRCVSAGLQSQRGDVEVMLIDPRNYFIFYPLLIEAGTGRIEPRHAVVSIRSLLRRSAFRMGTVTRIDFDAQCVTYEAPEAESVDTRTIHFDHVVIAPGSVTMMPDVRGLAEFGFEMKGMDDAILLRDRAIRFMELASSIDDRAARRHLLQYVIVGANFTGAELAGELQEFLKRLVRKYPTIDPDECNVTLVEQDTRILRVLSRNLSAYAERSIRARGVDIRTSDTVREIHDTSATLASGDRIEASTTIWCAGIAPNPLIAAIDVPVDSRGYMKCDRMCRIEGAKNAWGVGDSAVNLDAQGNPYPSTAQHARKEGVHVAEQILRVMRGDEPKPLDYKSKGTLAALGARTGVAEVMGRNIAGFWAWWLFRTFYVLRMPGLGRKVRVAIDWTLDLFFERDDVQLGVHISRRHRKRVNDDDEGSGGDAARPTESNLKNVSGDATHAHSS